MTKKNHNEERGLDITDHPTDEYPVLRESDLHDGARGARADRRRLMRRPSRKTSGQGRLLAHALETEVSRLHAKWQSIDAEFKTRETQITVLHEEIRRAKPRSRG